MQRYGRLDGGELVLAVPPLKLRARYVIHPTAEQYASLGFLPVAEEPPAEPAPARSHWEPQGWEERDGAVRRTYAAVADPPRTFSKFSLELALFAAGLLDAADAFVDSQTIDNGKGGTMPLRRAYSTAITFSEDHPYFERYLALAKAAIGVTDGQAEAILAASVADG